MRIFYITSVLGDVGGSEIYTRDLLEELAARGHEVLVFSTEPCKVKGVRVEVCPTRGHHALHKFQAPLYWKRALALAREFRPDVIQSHSNSLMGYIGARLKQKLDVPHVLLIELLSAHNTTLHTKTIHEMEKHLLKRIDCDRLVLWTKRMRDQYAVPWGVPREKITVMPAALNMNNYKKAPGGKEVHKKYGKHLITSVKSLWGTNVEGLTYVVEAMKEVSQKHPEYKYLIFGGGKDKAKLDALVKKYGLEAHVKLPGPVSAQEAKAVIAATEIAPHSYVYEFSTSISLLEYLAWGKACVVTDMGSVRELVGDAAVVVRPRDARDMAKGIIKLIENQKMRKTLERRAKKRIRENNSIAVSVDRLEKIYRELLE